MIDEFAPAKINLALHVVGQREDGYHLLDTLVAFADIGDRVSVTASQTDGFSISGPFGGSLPLGNDPKSGNLVLRARDALRERARAAGLEIGQVSIHLEKNLPPSSGIGGGSADAAATLRALNRLWQLGLDRSTLSQIGIELGADVPMCIEMRPLRARGIGEDIVPIAGFPEFHMLLVNPLKPVSTPDIFRRLEMKSNPPMVLPQGAASMDLWLATLIGSRNDLQGPAEALEPAITEILLLLAKTRASFVRMSGSGATCFALYPDAAACLDALDTLEKLGRGWYWKATKLRGSDHEQN